MPVTVKLPKDEKEKGIRKYTLYVSGNVVYINNDPDYGTLMKVEGTAIAFYSASNSRRAIVFQEMTENDYGLELEEGTLPYIRNRVRIMYRVYGGRRIEYLKYMVYNLEKRYGKTVYSLPLPYWLHILAFIDTWRPPVKAKGKRSNKRQLYMITDCYMKRYNNGTFIWE